MVKKSFDEVLASLQKKNSFSNASREDSDSLDELGNVIVINKQRQFEIPAGFNTTIAYEGDVNSQIVTFSCPLYAEGYDLSLCNNKKIRWCNLSSGIEGSNNLTKVDNDDKSRLFLRWDVPPEAFTRSGVLQLSISLFDSDGGRLVFSWNTPQLSSLIVGETLNRVGDFMVEDSTGEDGNSTTEKIYLPAKNEILTIDIDTRKIIAPTNYNRVVGNYGDSGTSIVYFQIRRFFKGFDVIGENTRIKLFWRVANYSGTVESSGTGTGITRSLYAYQPEGNGSGGLANIVWKVPDDITQNPENYTGPFTIQLTFIDTQKNLSWNVSAFNELSLGEGGFNISTESLPDGSDKEQIAKNRYFIDGNTEGTPEQDLTIAGIVKHRQYFESGAAGTPLIKNEIAVEYDNNEIIGLKIGTQENQFANAAKYIAFSADKFVTLGGGNASGNEKTTDISRILIIKNDESVNWEQSNYKLQKGELGIGYLPNGNVVVKIGGVDENGELLSWPECPKIESVFDENLVITEKFGIYDPSSDNSGHITIDTQGKTISQVMQEALSIRKNPEITQPIFEVTTDFKTDTGTFEVGSKISEISWAGNFQDGLYEFGSKEENTESEVIQEAGLEPTYSIDIFNGGNKHFVASELSGTCLLADTELEYSEDYQFVATCSWLTSKRTPVNNFGEEAGYPLVSGSIFHESFIDFTPYREGCFYGALPDSLTEGELSSDIIRGLPERLNENYSERTLRYKVPVGTSMVLIACPADEPELESILNRTAGAEMLSSFKKTQLEVCGANNTSPALYNIYYYTPVEKYRNCAELEITLGKKEEN